ncbi:lytic transglycosylase domain-containing protein [Methylocystis sp. IM4]|uniref:lytic transglycosylase domain-containing protein n=2 Tax=Methylocystis TaxID=133 RepID=UPI0040534FB0
MIDASLCRDAPCNRACVGRRSARLRTIALPLLCALSALPAYAETARSEPIANETSHRLVITSALTKASNRFRLPVHWLRAVMRAESGGDAKSVSNKGAVGLMQLMPATYAELRTRYGLGTDPFDPYDNILAGAAYLRELLDQYGEHGFLAAYNAGPRRYEDYLRGRPLPAETTDYVQRIASAISFGEGSATPYSASSGNPASPIFMAVIESEGHCNTQLRYSVDTGLRPEGSARRSLIRSQPDVRLFSIDLHAANGPNASSPAALSRGSSLFAVRRPLGASQ